MKNILKQENGVTLISLAVVIIILGIIMSMLLYSVKDTNDVTKLTNLYSDIDNLTDKISNYYSKYGKIPAFEKQGLNEKVASLTNSPIGVNDTGNFLVIDLNAIENLTLNYGQDFKIIKNNELGTNTDLYIINENSHNIFYLKGIKIENKIYYTNASKDTQKVDLHYIDGIQIPEGYTYKSGNKETEIIITDNENKEFKWADVENKKFTITQNGDDILAKDVENNEITLTVNDNYEFLNSVAAFGGFFLSSDNSVAYILADETDSKNWSQTYDVETTYVDKNGDTAYIPQGFKISKLSSLNTINKGLVIKNATTGDEYVWISVPTRVLKNVTKLEDIEKALQEYAGDYREDGYEDKWYEGCGIATETAYNELKNKMLQSIKTNGGFYVGRYEAGKDDGNYVCLRDKKPWHTVTISEAQGVAQAISSNNNYNTSLMFGIQWNLICKFIEETGTKTQYDIKNNSTSWGNCKNTKSLITSENAMKLTTDGAGWNSIEKGEYKNEGEIYLLTTRACENNQTINIYDLSGNDYEILLERGTSNDVGVRIGGSYADDVGVLNRTNWGITSKLSKTGFRVALFK